MNHLLIIIGTRPELIKTAPIIRELIFRGLQDRFTVLNTAQHKDLLDPYWGRFGIQADFNLDVMKAGQSLSDLTAKVLVQLQGFLQSRDVNNIDTILAQGDTTTVLGASMVAFYNRINFVHLEAGLRSNDMDNPFPEEYNRRIASINASLHLAPTIESANNLKKEGILSEKIKVIGNTVVDALTYITQLPAFSSAFDSHQLNSISFVNRNAVLITCHRRENHGDNLTKIIYAICQLAAEFPHLQFIWPVHPNPNVFEFVSQSNVKDYSNITISPPLEYMDMLRLLGRCCVAISDSGGIQEEAPSFGVPVIVLREKTERPEGIKNGLAVLTGADPDKIKVTFKEVIHKSFSNIHNPYGDGRAAFRAVEEVLNL